MQLAGLIRKKLFPFFSFADIVDDFTSKDADEGIFLDVVLCKCLFINQLQ